MGIKRGVWGNASLIIFSILLLAVLDIQNASAQTGKECSTNVNSVCSGKTISAQGYGAVELCQVCYKCGASDGVCPESYSDGVLETNTLKTNVTMRVKRATFESDIYTIAYNTGKKACDSIGGDCDSVLRSEDNLLWVAEPGGCSKNTAEENANNNAYFMAICKDVPRKAGCELCPDPDCTNNLSGYAFENTAERAPLDGVNITVKSNNNNALAVWPNGISVNGIYIMKAVSGQLNITCSKEGYTTYSKIKYLGSGNNIFDCAMDRAIGACTSTCYIIDVSGDSVCDSSCDGINGCDMSEEAKAVCDGKVFGTRFTSNEEIIVSPWNNCKYSNVTYIQCCNGSISSQIYRIVGPGGCNCDFYNANCNPIGSGSTVIKSEASDLLTRSIRKVLNGKPVEIKIIVYHNKPVTLKNRE